MYQNAEYVRKTVRERRKRQRIRRKLFLGIRRAAFCVIIVCVIRFGVAQAGKLFYSTGNVTWQGEDVPAGYIAGEDASLITPVLRSGDELKNEIKKLAERDDAYQEIYESFDSYPEELLSALCSNPEMLSYVQGYLEAEPAAAGGFTKDELKTDMPLLLQWDKRWGYAPYGSSRVGMSGCAPTCLSMVVLALTGNEAATPAEVAAYAQEAGYYLKGTGTSWSLMTEGCEHYGVHGSEISLDENVIRTHLANGEPVICSMRPGDFTSAGHFIVLIGEADGKITVNDPNSRERSRVLWDYQKLEPQIKNLWAFSR